MPRSSLSRAKRIVVKVGTGTLTDGEGRFDRENCARLGDELAALSRGRGLVLVSSGAVALGADDLASRTRFLNARRTFERLLALGVVPVVNENDTVAVDEIKVGDNDTLAGLVAGC